MVITSRGILKYSTVRASAKEFGGTIIDFAFTSINDFGLKSLGSIIEEFALVKILNSFDTIKAWFHIKNVRKAERGKTNHLDYDVDHEINEGIDIANEMFDVDAYDDNILFSIEDGLMQTSNDLYDSQEEIIGVGQPKVKGFEPFD